MLSKWHDGEVGYVIRVGEEVPKQRQVQNKTRLVNENIVFYCTRNETLMQSNTAKYRKLTKPHTCGVSQRSVHSLQEMFELLSTLLLTHVNAATHARAHTSQRRGELAAQTASNIYRTWRTSSDSTERIEWCEVWRTVPGTYTKSSTGRMRIITEALMITHSSDIIRPGFMDNTSTEERYLHLLEKPWQ
jgi:hypothetical protein